MDSKGLDACSSLEPDKACWRCCCRDGRKEDIASGQQVLPTKQISLCRTKLLRQDCCLIFQPYPVSLEDSSNMSVEDTWHARPQLFKFFKCLLHPRNVRLPKIMPGCVAPMTLRPHLMFFSTFEELKLPAMGPIDHATTKLYVSVRAVPYSNPVRWPLLSYARPGATPSLVPER